MRGKFDVDIAEATALRHSLKISIKDGFTRLVAETDNMKLYSHLKKGMVEPSGFGSVVGDIFSLARVVLRFLFLLLKDLQQCSSLLSKK